MIWRLRLLPIMIQAERHMRIGGITLRVPGGIR
jgi:hypothetical protein